MSCRDEHPQAAPASAAWRRLLSVAVSTLLAMAVASGSEDASASVSIVGTSRRRLLATLPRQALFQTDRKSVV